MFSYSYYGLLVGDSQQSAESRQLVYYITLSQPALLGRNQSKVAT